jgi:hypothetical protein
MTVIHCSLAVCLLTEVALLDRQEMGSKVFIQDPARTCWSRSFLSSAAGVICFAQLSSTWAGYVLFAFLRLAADSERGRAISAL